VQACAAINIVVAEAVAALFHQQQDFFGHFFSYLGCGG